MRTLSERTIRDDQGTRLSYQYGYYRVARLNTLLGTRVRYGMVPGYPDRARRLASFRYDNRDARWSHMVGITCFLYYEYMGQSCGERRLSECICAY